MKLDLQLGKIFNVPVVLAFDWLLFVLVFTLITALTGGGSALNVFLAIMSISIAVLLHEFGHVLAARKYKVKTTSVTLHCYGGIAQFKQNDVPKLFDKPHKALLVWGAGPMVNVVLFILCFIGLMLSTNHPTLFYMLRFLTMVNFTLAAFNLLPFMPLDGGIMFMSALRYLTTKQMAVKIASYVGMADGAALVLLAFKMSAIMMGLIGGMIIINCWSASKNSPF